MAISRSYKSFSKILRLFCSFSFWFSVALTQEEQVCWKEGEPRSFSVLIPESTRMFVVDLRVVWEFSLGMFRSKVDNDSFLVRGVLNLLLMTRLKSKFLERKSKRTLSVLVTRETWLLVWKNDFPFLLVSFESSSEEICLSSAFGFILKLPFEVKNADLCSIWAFASWPDSTPLGKLIPGADSFWKAMYFSLRPFILRIELVKVLGSVLSGFLVSLLSIRFTGTRFMASSLLIFWSLFKTRLSLLILLWRLNSKAEASFLRIQTANLKRKLKRKPHMSPEFFQPNSEEKGSLPFGSEHWTKWQTAQVPPVSNEILVAYFVPFFQFDSNFPIEF